MRVWLVLLAGFAIAALAGAAVVRTTASAAPGGVPLCRSVRASASRTGPGAETGGTLVYRIYLTTFGTRACSIEGRPWVRVPPTKYPVTIDHLTSNEVNSKPEQLVTITPHRSHRAVSAYVMIAPGSCARDRGEMAGLFIRVGYEFSNGVSISNSVCKIDGGPRIYLGTFGRYP